MTAVTQDSQDDLSYTLERFDDEQWHRVLDGFQDASIFQTVPFAVAKSSSQTIEHLVVCRGGAAVAAAQVRLFSVPFMGSSLAYVLWGPVCHRYGSDPDWGALREALRALRQEYVVKRRIGLRVKAGLAYDIHPAVVSMFTDEGYRHVTVAKQDRTIVIDLNRSLDELRKGLDKKWRNCLNAAEKNGLDVVEGTDDTLFEPFLTVYQQMLSRKQLVESSDIQRFRAIQSMLPDRYKMNVVVVSSNGQPCAGAICSAIGRKGIYLFGGTADAGMKNKASYLVQWRAIQWLKAMQCAEYDLHGINPQTNPGVYAFKAGLAGKNGRDVEFIGNFEAHGGVGSQLLLQTADRINHEYKKLKNMYGKYWGARG